MAAYADYKELIVWQKSRRLVKLVYLLTRQLPREEVYSLSDQMRRAAISIPSNIAEGYNRNSDNEFAHFLKIAKGSAAELETQLILCIDLEYLTQQEAQQALLLAGEILRGLGAFIQKIKSKKEKRS